MPSKIRVPVAAVWALLGPVSPAFAQSVDAPQPARTGRDNVFHVRGVDPGHRVRLLLGEAGSEAVRPCPGLRTDLGATWVSPAHGVDASGEVEVVARIPAALAGRTTGAQVVDLDACVVSPVTWTTWPSTLVSPLSIADVRFQGVGNDFRAGTGVTGVGDMDGDGRGDIAIGADVSHGTVYLFSDPASMSGDVVMQWGASGVLTSEPQANASHVGSSLAALGDLNADGFDDLLVGADAWSGRTGAAYVVLGPVSGSHSLGTAHARLRGTAGAGQAGFAVAGLGDVSGDGRPDFAISEPWKGASNEGAIYIFTQPVSGEADLDAVADARVLGTHVNEVAGYALSAAGDVDGDGLRDMWVRTNTDMWVSDSPDRAHLFLGPMSGDIPTSASWATLRGRAGDVIGSLSEAGDVNGDGYVDAIFASRTNDEAGGPPAAGAAYVVYGPFNPGMASLDEADATLLGDPIHPELGRVDGAGDANGDGFDDVVASTSNDRVWGVLGPVYGTLSLLDADLQLHAEGRNDWTVVSAAGDLQGDGYADLLVGAELNDAAGGIRAGAAYLILGQPF